MKFITCASYYGSGSSVVTDFVSEFDNVKSLGETEFRFIQDPDGISDLEYNLVENFNRHNSGYALKKYKQMVDFQNGNFLLKRYREILGDSWHKYSYKYIDELTDFTYHGWWNYDTMSKGTLFYIRKRLLNKILKKTIWREQPERTLNTMKNEITYCSHPTEDYFIEVTKKYISEMFKTVSDTKDIMMVDQLVPPTNLSRYLRYFDDIKVVVVDRDPRDIYVLEKYVWRDGVIPNDVEKFCDWFIYTRQHRQQDNLNTENIKFIMFEDMVYNYEQQTDKLMTWLALDASNHTHKKDVFNPDYSMKNTQTWKKYPVPKADIEYIEKRLADYLYSF